jgi:hypothetical protein
MARAGRIALFGARLKKYLHHVGIVAHDGHSRCRVLPSPLAFNHSKFFRDLVSPGKDTHAIMRGEGVSPEEFLRRSKSC